MRATNNQPTTMSNDWFTEFPVGGRNFSFTEDQLTKYPKLRDITGLNAKNRDPNVFAYVARAVGSSLENIYIPQFCAVSTYDVNRELRLFGIEKCAKYASHPLTDSIGQLQEKIDETSSNVQYAANGLNDLNETLQRAFHGDDGVGNALGNIDNTLDRIVRALDSLVEKF